MHYYPLLVNVLIIEYEKIRASLLAIQKKLGWDFHTIVTLKSLKDRRLDDAHPPILFNQETKNRIQQAIDDLYPNDKFQVQNLIQMAEKLSNPSFLKD